MWTEIILIVYAVILLGIALLSLKYNTTLENFLVAGHKQRKILVVASMLASTIGGGITIGTVANAYRIGFPAFWFVAAGGLAHFLQGALLSERVRASEALTLPDLAHRYLGPAVRMEISLIILVTWIGISAAQFVAAARVITTLTGLPHAGAVTSAAVFIVVYTLIGGQKSVLRTDLFQFGILAGAIVLALGYLFLVKPPVSGSIRLDLFNRGFRPPGPGLLPGSAGRILLHLPHDVLPHSFRRHAGQREEGLLPLRYRDALLRLRHHLRGPLGSLVHVEPGRTGSPERHRQERSCPRSWG